MRPEPSRKLSEVCLLQYWKTVQRDAMNVGRVKERLGRRLEDPDGKWIQRQPLCVRERDCNRYNDLTMYMTSEWIIILSHRCQHTSIKDDLRARRTFG